MMRDTGYEDPVDVNPGSRLHEDEPVPRWALPSGEEPGAGTFALDMVHAWVEDNLNVAILGAFAVGVFVGVLVRR